MEDGQPPAKRPKYDLADTFDVVVGKGPSSRLFTVYSNVLTSRSGFFKAARNPEWLADPTEPVDLPDEDPEVFPRYLNCVYFGIEALQLEANAPEDDRDDGSNSHSNGIGNRDKNENKKDLEPDAFLCSETEHAKDCEEGMTSRCKYAKYLDQCSLLLIDLYLLADQLQDLMIANLVIDELIRFSAKGNQATTGDIIRRVCDSSIHGAPLRKYSRDVQVYEAPNADYMDYHVDPGHAEFTRDVMVEFLRLRDPNGHKSVNHVYRTWKDHGRFVDKCCYHQHSETHPRCAPEPEKQPESSTDWRVRMAATALGH